MMAAFNYSITRPITDSFHEGEYLGGLWTIRSYLSGTTPFPLLVHGPMDFLPAMLAGAQSHDQAIIVLTRAINTGVAGITWILFFDVLLKLLLRNEHRLAAGLLSVALFIGMIAIIPADVVERQQAFLAIRDLFLMAALWCTLTGLSARSPQRRHLLLLLGGVAAAASLYWAYDRFLATVAFGCPLILALLLQRAWKPAATLIVGGVAGLFVIPLIAPTGTLAKNAANLTYWLTFSGEVWHISILVRMPAIPTAIAMIVLLMIFAKMWMAEWKEQRTDLSLSFVAGLLGLQAFFLIKYFNLPRQPNNYYFVWPFVLLLAGLTLRSPLLGRINDMLRDFWTAIHAGGARQRVGLAPVTLSLVAIISNNMAFASLMNLRALVRPPADANMLPTAVVAATHDVLTPKDGCVLLWSNEGVFATALRRPFCTRYTYPVYAAARYEADLLRQLQSTPPAIIIFDSPFWSMNIYGRTMQQRLPIVDRDIRERYKFFRHHGYLVGRRQMSTGPDASMRWR